MKRRSFFTALAGGLLALKSGKALAVLAAPQKAALVVNPAWVSAPYEVVFYCSPGTFKRLVPERFI